MKLGAFDLRGPHNEPLRPNLVIEDAATNQQIGQFNDYTTENLSRYYLVAGTYRLRANDRAIDAVEIKEGQTTTVRLR